MFRIFTPMAVPRLRLRLPLTSIYLHSPRLRTPYSTTKSNENDTQSPITHDQNIKTDSKSQDMGTRESLTRETLEIEENSSNKRGKKLRPTKANIVVLDAKQSGLLRKREAPEFFKKRSVGGKLSILEGIELGNNTDIARYTDSKSLIEESTNMKNSSTEILREIQSQGKKLLVFKSSVSKEQALRSINYQRPATKVLSKKRYEQIKQLLESAYTVPQLKSYAKKYYNIPKGHTTKAQIISKIMDDCWECSINDSINESEDLIMERIIDVNTRDMYLLLLTNNGKILNNFARVGATVAVALDENIVIVRGTAPIIRYVEVSLNKILANVYTLKLPVKDIVSHYMKMDTHRSFKVEELISLVQRESAVYFEKASLDSEEHSDTYELSAFGSKRVHKAQNLLLWGVKYQPQLTEKTIFYCSEDRANFKKFPFSNTECLDWIDRTEEWCRLQLPITKKYLNSTLKSSHLSLNDEDLDNWYDFLISTNQTPSAVDFESDKKPSKMFSITLGQILTPVEGDSLNKVIFEPKISQITSKLLELPLYDSLDTNDELFTVDQHEYYVQLKFIPDLSTVKDKIMNLPPIELWFELDDYDNAITSTARCLVQVDQKSLLLQTPQLKHDYKISTDTVSELTEIFDENQEDWLADQPGIKSFLRESQLSFDNKKKLVIPKSMTLNLPLKTVDDKSNSTSIKYQYVNANYHRVLKLLYMNKYMVQFSYVNSGFLGGRYTQIDFVGEQPLTREEFKQFVSDISKTF